MIKSEKTIYWTVYKKIEKEVQELTFFIHFCDEQKKVFSLGIADLIIRCAMEIESIVKDIYRKEKQEEPQKAGDCIKWIEDVWNISKKEIVINSSDFYFNKKNICKPFDYKNGAENDYYSVYNAIKHDRIKNINKATVEILIQILGALYILNIYYYDRRIQLKNDRYATNLDKGFGSEIFLLKVAPCKDDIILSSEEDINPENCIYRIIRKDSQFAFSLSYKDMFGEKRSMSMVMINKPFQDLAEFYINQLIDINKFWEELSKFSTLTPEQMKNYFMIKNKAKEILSIKAYKMKSTFWAELNK